MYTNAAGTGIRGVIGDDDHQRCSKGVYSYGPVPRIGEKLQSASGALRLGSKKVSKFFFALFIVAGLVLTTYFGTAAWRLSDEGRGDVTGQIGPGHK